MVIAVVNSKGGVGKTTTSVNLAAALTAVPPRERRILIVDLDSQAAASSYAGIQRSRLKPSSASCLLHDYPVLQAVRRTRTPHLDIITGSLDLANADVALCDTPGRETALKQMLAPLVDRYDVIVLDCPPGLSLLTVNAFVAADALIVPVMPRYLVLHSITDLIGVIDKVRIRMGATPRLLGLLIVMIDRKRAPDVAIRQRFRTQYAERVFTTEIPFHAVFEDAAAAGKPVSVFAPRSTAAAAFRELAGEVVQRAGLAS